MPPKIDRSILNSWIDKIELLPKSLRKEVENLSEVQLDTPYRPGGWTVRQVMHHIPDSHMNSYIRFKWALTEKQPLIKAYYQDRWAELEDGKTASIDSSLLLLEGLHKRWGSCLRRLSDAQLQKCFIHPETNNKNQLDTVIGMYAWHGEHHLSNRIARENQLQKQS